MHSNTLFESQREGLKVNIDSQTSSSLKGPNSIYIKINHISRHSEKDVKCFRDELANID